MVWYRRTLECLQLTRVSVLSDSMALQHMIWSYSTIPHSMTGITEVVLLKQHTKTSVNPLATQLIYLMKTVSIYAYSSNGPSV